MNPYQSYVTDEINRQAQIDKIELTGRKLYSQELLVEQDKEWLQLNSIEQD